MATIDDIKKLFKANQANMNKGFENLQGQMKDFKEEVKQTITDSLKLTNEKVDLLETQLKEKEEKITTLQREFDLHKRKNNLIIFGIQENETTIVELEAITSNIFKKVTGIEVNGDDFNDIYRIGKKGEKCRPILISFLSCKKITNNS